jgi:hypothetical protein
MRVDPQVLRAFAGRVDTASTKIAGAALGHAVSVAGDGLPGSATQWAARLVGEHIAMLEAKFATGVGDMRAAVHGAGDRYEAEDDALSREFDGLFG